MLKETPNFYKSRNRSIHVCAIDASKAFDKVNRILMMYKLKSKLTDIIWRTMYEYYRCSQAFVVKGQEYSSIFKTTIGVKQGGHLSPWLFSIYVEDLLNEIESSSIGTEVYGVKTGVIMFADDLLVICDSKSKMQCILKIIEKYCNKKEIKINGNKTQYIQIGPKTKTGKTKLKL